MASTALADTWKALLGRVEKTHEPRPLTRDNVVDIPNGLEKLRRAIVDVTGQLEGYRCQRDEYAEAWAAALAEFNAAMDRNTVCQRDTAARLRKLQEEWMRVTNQLGIECRLPPVIDVIDGKAEVGHE